MVIDAIAAGLALAPGRAGPRTLVVTAGPGAGKTYTIGELSRSLVAATRWTTADDLSWRQPYSVAAALLDVQLPSPTPAGFAATLTDAVETLCATEPHVLIVDDVHNADSGSLEFFCELAAAARDLPLVLLLVRRHLPVRDLLTRLVTNPWVRQWQLPPMDSADLDALTLQVVGGSPDEHVAEVVARSGGNPLHACVLLEELRRAGTLRVGAGAAGAAGTASVDPAAAATLSQTWHGTVRQQLSLLDERSRALVQTLAVWGRPASIDEVAELDGIAPSALVGPAQTAIDVGVLVIDGGGTLSLAHQVYGEVAIEGLAPSLRRVLHTSIARRPEDRGHHHMGAHHLLHTAAAGGGSAPLRTPELTLATALARSGQLTRSAEVARDGLASATDTATTVALHLVLLFTLLAQGKTTQVTELTAATLELGLDEATRAGMVDLQRYVAILGGTTVLPSTPGPTGDGATVSELVTEALRLFLAGHGTSGLALALEASRRETDADVFSGLTPPADIWPAVIALYVHGPAPAEALLDHATQRRSDRGATWMTAYHLFARAGIEMSSGRLDDATALLDAGVECAANEEMGWASPAEGTRALIDVYRGDSSQAALRLDRWSRSGVPDPCGLPVAGQARMLLLESQRKLRPAVAQSRLCWAGLVELGIMGWLPRLAVDSARIAVRAGASDFIETITEGLAALPRATPPGAQSAVSLALALCAGSPGRITEVAVASARTAHQLGDAVAEAEAWEEAACAAAAGGDKAAARHHARQALLITRGMGATGLSTRICSRLRPLGLRLDARTVRDRPLTGWDSLTRTEVTIAELVASGYNGAEIAEKLFISQRTVQTHVSHALRKLDLRTRVELAALVAAR